MVWASALSGKSQHELSTLSKAELIAMAKLRIDRAVRTAGTGGRLSTVENWQRLLTALETGQGTALDQAKDDLYTEGFCLRCGRKREECERLRAKYGKRCVEIPANAKDSTVSRPGLMRHDGGLKVQITQPSGAERMESSRKLRAGDALLPV